MITVKDIKLVNRIITCRVLGDSSDFILKIYIKDWLSLYYENGDELDAIHVRNRLYSLYNENDGKLPESFILNFG